MSSYTKIREILKEMRLREDGFAGTGVSGVAGIGVAVNGDASQAEPGVNMKKSNSVVMNKKILKRKVY